MQEGKLGEEEKGGGWRNRKKRQGARCFKVEMTAAAAVSFG